MVGKDAPAEELDEEALARVRLIAEKKRQLDETADQVRHEIRSCFERLAEVLRGREKQLLRQVEAVHRQQLSLVQSNSALLPVSTTLGANLSGEPELVEQLRDFGKLELSNSIALSDSEPYKAEEYQEATEDIVNFDKSLKSEAEEFDVSSVIRRKRDSGRLLGKNILSINLNCTSCEACKFENDVTPGYPSFHQVAVNTVSTSKESAKSPVTPGTSISSISSPLEKSPILKVESENNASLSTNAESLVTIESPVMVAEVHSENVYFVDESRNNNSSRATEETNENASKTDNDSANVKVQNKMKDDEHPIQIQQWLKQILAETETEPIIHEIGQFSKIPNTRLYCEFPVET